MRSKARWFVALIALVRVVLLFVYRFDSDETQHMHVAWGWAHGLVQYRDLFDNHMPLFHLLAAPIFLLPEHPWLLFVARAAMLPCFFATGWLTYLLGGRLFGEDTGIFAALLALAFPPFFLGTLEFRTDDLWVVCWMAILLCVLDDRWQLAGWLTGLAFCVSMKTSLFVIAIVAAARRVKARFLVFVIPPAIVSAAFAAAGVWPQMKYAVFTHNRVVSDQPWRIVWILPCALLWLAAGRIADRRVAFVARALVAYAGVMSAFWPVLSRESWLPVYPLACMLAAPVMTRYRSAIVLAALAITIVIAKPWRNEAREALDLVAGVQRLTRPNETIMDFKGESVFRRRAWYLVLEDITNRKLRSGAIRDTIPEALERGDVHVVVDAAHLPIRSFNFAGTSYVPWGPVYVAGFRLPAFDGHPIAFDVRIAGDYTVLGPNGVIAATIDGTSAGTTRYLTAGTHTIVCSTPTPHPLVIWSRVLGDPEFARRRWRAVEGGTDPRDRARLLRLFPRQIP